MRFLDAVDRFIADWQAEGRINSPHTERAYRECLELHAADVGGRDPGKTGKRDVQKTLARWAHPNTRAQKHTILRTFYRWAVYEDLRATNPVDQVRPPRKREPEQRRLTLEETRRVVAAADPVRRDRWAVRLMLLAGVRNDELRSLQGRHLSREGWVWIDRDAGKGGKERWVPVCTELEAVVAEIQALVELEDYVLPGRRRVNPPHGTVMRDEPQAKLHGRSLARQMARIGERAQLPFHLTPHALRHTFATRATRLAGDRPTQAALGHASIQTTIDTYSANVSLDELRVSFHGFGFGLPELSTPERGAAPQEDPHAR